MHTDAHTCIYTCAGIRHTDTDMCTHTALHEFKNLGRTVYKNKIEDEGVKLRALINTKTLKFQE